MPEDQGPWGRGAWKSIRHAAAVPRLQLRRPSVTRLPLAMALMADSGQPVVRVQKSGPPFEHGRWSISKATDNTPAPSSLIAEIRKKTPHHGSELTMSYLGKKFGNRNAPATRLTRRARMGLVGRLFSSPNFPRTINHSLCAPLCICVSKPIPPRHTDPFGKHRGTEITEL